MRWKEVHEFLSLLNKGKDSNNETSLGEMTELEWKRVAKKENRKRTSSMFLRGHTVCMSALCKTLKWQMF